MSGEASDRSTRAFRRDIGDGMRIRRDVEATRETLHVIEHEDQPAACEGQAGRDWVAERLVVPVKPGNAGGGKGPQFKGNARRSEGGEIGQPSNSG